jgi:DUF1707 SHOCT-like domain
MTTGPGDEIAPSAGAGDGLPVYPVDREQAIHTLKAALAQGRLTEDEYDTRAARASVARSPAELAVLTADLPVGLARTRPPAASDVRTGICLTIAAASVIAAVLVWHPDNGLAFMVFFVAAVTLLVAPVVTVGLMVDVRHQKRSGGQLPPGATPSAGG